ncbi:carbohydrate ABC transporter permease [Nonomuraea wenchangensis]|uniref:Multiple sugar transport system permease protein n=1 Tax=Nonomuraea wenchangensis TaxID=568860 RepID=A0A1I0L6L3_9ACTN|nr:carbohydrate ABC transporter permease [Nonomuraea wenchangensis]SEU35418.1 multiple sugar transport system permease protein [Nonomuraea wenchangensis]
MRAWRTVVGVVLVGVMLFPVYWMFNVSLTKTSDMRADPPHWFPWDPTFEGYAAAFGQQLPALATSLFIGLGTVALTLAVSLPAGFALAKLRPRGGRTIDFLLLVAQMIPGVVMAMGFYAIYIRLGLLNTVPGLIVADSTLAVPFGVLLFRAFMASIPAEVMAAAQIDGASTWRTFVSIVLPLSRNSVITVSLFAFLWAWSDFIFASTLNRNSDVIPITLGIFRYIGNNTTQWNSIMATAVIASLPAAFLLVLAQRYIAAGVTAGAVKD